MVLKEGAVITVKYRCDVVLLQKCLYVPFLALKKNPFLIKISQVYNIYYVLTCWHNVSVGNKAGLTPDSK